MYKKVYRLKKKYQFNYVYRAGKSLSSKNLILYFAGSKNKNVKVGISVSKKLGNAVVRNKTKRRIRECITPHLSSLKNNYNIVIVAKNIACNASFSTLNNELFDLLSKAKLFKEASHEKTAKNPNQSA